MMGEIVQEIEKHWAIVVAVGSAVFFLYKIRAEETLRTRLKLIYECYNSFALVNDVVQDWAHPVIQTTIEEKNQLFMESLQKLMPDAQKHFHQTSVLMRPETVRALNKVFMLLGLLRAEYSNWQMYKKIQEDGAYHKELQKAFDNARKNLPAEIQRTVHDLLTDFQILVNGSAKMLWWKITGCCYLRYRNAMNHKLLKSFDEDRKALLASLK